MLRHVRVAAAAPLLLASAVQAADPLTTWTETATRLDYNGALGLKWPTPMGDKGVAMGSAFVADLDTVQTVRIPVTGTDILLTRSGGLNVQFHSRESTDAARRPALVINGRTRCAATRDTILHASTLTPQGTQPLLSTAGTILVAFDDCAVAPGDRLALELTTTGTQFGAQTLTAYAAAPRPAYPASPVAADGTTADIVLRISGDAWRTQALSGSFLADRNTVMADGTLWATAPTGSDTATNAYYAIPPAARATRMFLRYTMTVAGDWWTDTGGKWPGLANTGQADRRAAKAGWGGRQADGINWSARLQRQVHGADPFAASHINVQPYIYRVNRVTLNGDTAPSAGVFAKGRTVVVDQMVELNSMAPGGAPNADGRIAIWVDGRCVSVMTGIVFRTSPSATTLPSEVWLDTYEGGVGVRAPHPMGVRYGPVIVSKRLLPLGVK